RDLVELLFSPLSQHDSQPAGDRVPHPPATPSARQAADRLGWPAESPQPNGVGLRAPAARALVVGVSAGLRSGTEPGRVPVGALEAPSTAKLLSRQLRRTQLSRSPSITTDAPPTYAGLRFLAAGGAVS